MKRLFVLLAALAATSAIVAGSASAGSVGTYTCTDGETLTTANVGIKNVDVPAGVHCYAWYPTTIKGNVTVEGTLLVSGVTFVQNVTVNGGGFQSFNGGTWIGGNLTITNSAGYPDSPVAGNMNALWGDSGNPVHIVGNLTYSNNSAPLYVGNDAGSVLVKKNFTAIGNTSWVYTPGLQTGASF